MLVRLNETILGVSLAARQWKTWTGLHQLFQRQTPPQEKGKGGELCHYFCRYELIYLTNIWTVDRVHFNLVCLHIVCLSQALGIKEQASLSDVSVKWFYPESILTLQELHSQQVGILSFCSSASFTSSIQWHTDGSQKQACHELSGLTSWHPVCLSLGDPPHLALHGCHHHHSTLPEADGSWQQRTRDRVSTGAHLPESGPRQVRAFPHISQAREQLLAPRTHTSSCPAFDIVCFHIDGGWWTPDHCLLSIFIAPINQTLRYMFNEKSPDN